MSPGSAPPWRGDLGFSRLHARPVLEVLLPRLGNTLILLGIAFLLTLAIALPIGTIAAVKRGSATDYAINFAAFAGISTPPFWLALLLIMLFSVSLGWLPAGGMATIGIDSVTDRAAYLVLPVITLTLASVGGYTRYTRAAMGEALAQDYVRTAWAKGAGLPRIVVHHALRNALIPIVTIIALDFGTLFSGALITETMFSYLGMGKLIFDSILGNDFNLALVGLLFATLADAARQPRRRRLLRLARPADLVSPRDDAAMTAPPPRIAPRRDRPPGWRCAASCATGWRWRAAGAGAARPGGGFRRRWSSAALGIDASEVDLFLNRFEAPSSSPIRWAPTNSAATCWCGCLYGGPVSRCWSG